MLSAAIKRSVLLAMALAMFILPAWSAQKVQPKSTAAIRIALQINRKLITDLSEEYQKLHARQVEHFSQNTEKKMHDLEVEIVSLNSDALRLEHSLAQQMQAEEMLKGLIARKLAEIRSDALPQTPASGRDLAYKLHSQALAEVEAGRLDEAVKLYQEVILNNPNDDEAYLIMGHCELMLGHYEKAELAFHSSISIDPQNINDITPFYENRILRDPNDDQAYADLGYAWLMLGDFLKAKEAFRNALSINPQNEPSLRGMETIRLKG